MKSVTRSAVRAAVAALLSSVAVVCAQAASLGRLEVLSAAGQPLVAEIAVDGLEPGSFDTLKAGVADAAAFKQAQLDPSPLLSRLRFEVVRGLTADKATIRITSSEPIPVRYLDTLIELNWSSGKVVREYTLAASRSAAPATEPPSAVTVAEPDSAAQTPVQPQSAASASPGSGKTPAAVSVEDATAYVVKRGESLSQIAKAVAPNPAALDATMAALFAVNRKAFIDNSIHKLREGAELQLPSASDLNARSGKAALQYLAEFDDRGDPYFQRALPTPRVVKPKQGADSSVSGDIGKVQAEQPPAKKEDQLKVSRSGADDKSAEAKANAQAEELLIREKALREANDRIAALEKNIADMQRLLELKAAAGVPKADAPAGDKTVPGAADKPIADAAAGDAGKAPEAASTDAQDALKTVDGALKPDAELAPGDKKDEAQLNDESDEEVKKPKPWYQNGLLLGGLGGALALGGGAVGFFFLKRRKAAAAQDAENANTEPVLDGGSDLLNADLGDPAQGNDEFASQAGAEPATADNDLSGLGDPDPTPVPAEADTVGAAAVDLDFAATVASDAPVESLLPPEMEAGDPPQPAASKVADSSDFLGELDSLSQQAEQASQAIDALKADADVNGATGDDDFAALGDEPLAQSDASDPASAEQTASRIGDALADIDLDLSPQGQALQVEDAADEIPLPLPSDAAAPAEKMDLAVWQEMETKLDLAAAYVEIGDGDSAKDLLNEVLKKGDSEQVAKARDLMGRA